jgi:hypothetical protein
MKHSKLNEMTSAGQFSVVQPLAFRHAGRHDWALLPSLIDGRAPWRLKVKFAKF